MNSRRALSLGLLVFTIGCSEAAKVPPPKPPIIYSVATQQYAQEPVYSRIRYVYLPEPIPSSSAPLGPEIPHQFNFKVKSVPLSKAAKILASLSSYDSYCSGSIADRRLTLQKTGTVDELAEAIAQQAQIRVVVDHQNREVRFFNEQGEQPRF